MLPFFKPLNEKMLMRVVPVLVALLFATTIGCSNEPEVVVVEKEVIKEVVVTATPEATSSAVVEGPTPTPTATPVPTPTPTSTPTATPVPTPTPISTPTATPVPTPTPISTPTATPTPIPKFVEVIAGNGHTCGVRADGAVVCRGNFGSSGRPVTSPPEEVRLTSITTSGYAICGLREDRKALCWNSEDTIVSEDEYVAISAVTTFGSSGRPAFCGLREDGVVDCGDTEVLPTHERFVSISAVSINAFGQVAGTGMRPT